MWLLVMFDLPVVIEEERKEATKFRNFLLDTGFHMANYSVYMRSMTSPAQASTIISSIRLNLPKAGKVSILSFTDKQYEQMQSYFGRAQKTHENP